MKRGIAILLSLCVLATVGYFTVSKWAIRHQTITFYDPARDNRPVAVDVAVRRDKEMQATAGMITLPVAILNHGNTVKFTEYSFLANIFAARGYLAISIQHDLPTDAPMVTKAGELYVGRLPQYQRDVANIRFAVDEMKKVETNADYDHLTMVGHSNGGDVSMYFAKMYPDEIKKVVTLDNLRVPFVTGGKFLRRELHPLALVENCGNLHFAIDGALAANLSRMGGQNRAYQRFGEEPAQVGGTEACGTRVRQCQRQRSRTRRSAGVAARSHLPDVVLVLGDIGEMREIAEGAHDADGFAGRHAVEDDFQLAPCWVVVIPMEPDRGLPNALDQVEHIGAFLIAHGVAENSPKQPDVCA